MKTQRNILHDCDLYPCTHSCSIEDMKTSYGVCIEVIFQPRTFFDPAHARL